MPTQEDKIRGEIESINAVLRTARGDYRKGILFGLHLAQKMLQEDTKGMLEPVILYAETDWGGLEKLDRETDTLLSKIGL